MWKLTIVDDEGTKTVLPLSRGEYTNGRAAEYTIRLTERNISRKHMVLRKNGTGWIVEDLSSYNGCFVNGLRVSGNHELHDGDLLQVGDYRIELLNESAASDGDEAQEGAEVAPAAAAPVSRLAALPDRLVVVDGPSAGSEHPLDKDKLIVGRAEDADISINHNSVSRIHAEITTITPGTYEIVDCGSSNGVRVNGIKLDRRVIEDDDEIELGDVRMRFVRRGRFFRPGAVPRSANSFAPSASTSPSVPAPRKGLGMMMLVGALVLQVKRTAPLIGSEQARRVYRLLVAGAGGAAVYQLFNTDYWTGKLWLPIGLMLAAGFVLQLDNSGSRPAAKEPAPESSAAGPRDILEA